MAQSGLEHDEKKLNGRLVCRAIVRYNEAYVLTSNPMLTQIHLRYK